MRSALFQYAFLDGRLIGSENPAAGGNPRQVIERILTDGLNTLLLTLTPTSLSHYGLPGLIQHHLPMKDIPTRDQIAMAIELIHHHLSHGQRVWVHCQRGIDRTGAVIGSYLVSSGNGQAERVIGQLLERFPPQLRGPRMRELWEPTAELIRSFAGHDLPHV